MSLPDTFTGSDGTDLHTYNATWVQHPSTGGNWEINSNHAKQKSGSSASLYYYNSAPSSADYTVSSTAQKSSDGSNVGGISGRINTGALTYSEVRLNTTNIELLKRVSGTVTSLGTAAHGLANNADFTLSLVMSGTSIKAQLNGVDKVSVTDSAISATGFSGIQASTGTTNLYLDDFNCTGISASPTLFRRTENARIGSRC